MLGAGDAFSAGFLSGWLRGEDYDACCRYANACGALVVSRHGCAPAMPTPRRARLLPRQRRRSPHAPPDHDASLTRLHRVTAPRTHGTKLFVLRLRPSQPVLRAARSRPARTKRGCRALKRPLRRGRRRDRSARGLQGSIGLLCDDRYGQDALTRPPAAAGGSAGRSSCRDRIRSCSTTAARSARR